MSLGEISEKCWGVVALVGLPNAGKSTLLNRLAGRKLSIITRKAQTTRQAFYHGVRLGGKRVILADTPGLFIPRLSRDLYQGALGAVSRADLLLLVHDGRGEGPSARVLSFLRDWEKPLAIAINKTDIAREGWVFRQTEMWRGWFSEAMIFQISALRGTGLDYLRAELGGRLSEERGFSPREFSFSPLSLEEWAAEITREKILIFIHEELPWLARVETVGFERRGGVVRIWQIIWVPKQRHRAIFIGEGGAKLKMMGTAARLDMEEYFERKVYLSLEVKVERRARREREKR